MTPRPANPSKFTAKTSPAEARKNAFVWTIAALLLTLALALVPTPFYIVAPGKAIDLSTRLTVEGRPPPLRRFYLTDVTVARASLLLLAARFWPAVRIVRRDQLVPAGESARGYDRLMVDAMGESQDAAAIVAERAAGYAVAEPARSLVVRGFLASSRADGPLVPGDVLLRIGRRPLRSSPDLELALRGVEPGRPVAVAFVRNGEPGAASIVTVARPGGGARLGIFVGERIAKPDLPVPVRYDLGDIAGSSGGLMFALEIYAGLRPGPGRDPVAGTGTIASDGRVGPIEGVEQKLVAARRAGVGIFLVPRENYAAVAHATNMRVVPVSSFQAALAAIDALPK